MKNKLKILFCVLLAVILPFSFVGCKNKKGDGNKSQNEKPDTIETGGETKNDDGKKDEETFILNQENVNSIIISSSDCFDSYIEKLNESELLKSYLYPISVAGDTKPILDYVYYPYWFVSSYNQTSSNGSKIEFNKVYAEKNTDATNYFEITKNDDNNKIFIKMIYRNLGYSFKYFLYEINLTKTEISSINLSFLETTDNNDSNKKLTFAQAIFDLKNNGLEIGSGNICEFSTKDEQYLKNNFTKEKFSQISQDKWGYSFFEKFDFSQSKSYFCNETKMPNNQNLIDMFNKFNFLGAYDYLEEVSKKSFNNITNNLFAIIDNNDNLRYNNYRFEKAK